MMRLAEPPEPCEWLLSARRGRVAGLADPTAAAGGAWRGPSQTNGVRPATLTFAKRRSSWHAGRLAEIDPRLFRLADLPRIPVMTKADLMANWDRIVTDRRLSLRMVEATLAPGPTRTSSASSG